MNLPVLLLSRRNDCAKGCIHGRSVMSLHPGRKLHRKIFSRDRVFGHIKDFFYLVDFPLRLVGKFNDVTFSYVVASPERNIHGTSDIHSTYQPVGNAILKGSVNLLMRYVYYYISVYIIGHSPSFFTIYLIIFSSG